MSSRATEEANQAAKTAAGKWRAHVVTCAGCKPGGPMATCAPGLRLHRLKTDTAAELKASRAADSEQLPGQLRLI